MINNFLKLIGCLPKTKPLSHLGQDVNSTLTDIKFDNIISLKRKANLYNIFIVCSDPDMFNTLSNDELFNKKVTDYLDITKRIIEHFVHLNNNDSSKVSIIKMKKDDLLSGKIIKEI